MTSRDPEKDVLVSKTITSLVLMYLAYIAMFCPCRPELYKCHLTHFYLGLSVVVANLVFYNGFRILSYH